MMDIPQDTAAAGAAAAAAGADADEWMMPNDGYMPFEGDMGAGRFGGSHQHHNGANFDALAAAAAAAAGAADADEEQEEAPAPAAAAAAGVDALPQQPARQGANLADYSQHALILADELQHLLEQLVSGS
jgi:hypothetical protein